MKDNDFAAEHEKYEGLRKSYNFAEKAGNKEISETLRAEVRSLLKRIEAKGADYARMYENYKDAGERGKGVHRPT